MIKNTSVKFNVIDVIKNKQAYSIINIVHQADIYQDLFSSFMSCNLHIQDVEGFYSTLKGNERVILSFTDSKGQSLNLPMMIYGISEIERVKNNVNKYSLYLISEEALLVDDKVSGKYRSGTSDIIQRILKRRTDKRVIVDVDSVVDDYLIPNLETFNATDFLASFTKNYIFYENRDGFNYRNIESLIQQNSILEYSLNNSKSPNIDHYLDILSYRKHPKLNNLDNIKNKMYSCITPYTDISNKSSSEIVFDYSKEFQKINTITDVGFGSFSNYKKFGDNKFGLRSSIQANKQYRFSLMQQFDNNKIDVNVCPNLMLKVGDMMNILLDGERSRHLISAVHHKITSVDSFTILELCSNSN